ncbi:hypothetical protein, partial [Cellulophaga sp. BC115SP]|uniref:hypothetical protein n=1 Tax=Cellulophaga sp. BC115SP TaxID=2683263 RepID=UPI00196AD786
MITYPTKEDYSNTLFHCEEIKEKLEALRVLLNTTVNQGLYNTYINHSNDLINWIEEIVLYPTKKWDKLGKKKGKQEFCSYQAP